MEVISNMMGLLVVWVLLRAGYDEFVRPLFVDMTTREVVVFVAQGLLGAAGMWAMLVLVIGLAPVNM